MLLVVQVQQTGSLGRDPVSTICDSAAAQRNQNELGPRSPAFSELLSSDILTPSLEDISVPLLSRRKAFNVISHGIRLIGNLIIAPFLKHSVFCLAPSSSTFHLL